jgi:hypothetical protein
MKFQINPRNIRWWFWFITLCFMAAALTGWTSGYFFVIGISALQVIFFLTQEKSLLGYPFQIRVVYFAFTLFGLWPGLLRIIMISLLALGTIMVTFFGRCFIAQILKFMPWNKTREIRLN